MRSVNLVDIYVNDEELEQIKQDIDQTKSELMNASQKLKDTSAKLISDNRWQENGKTECASLIDLISSYISCISGDTVSANGEGGLADKNVSSDGDHMSVISDATDVFLTQSSTFEKGGGAVCVTELDNIQ